LKGDAEFFQRRQIAVKSAQKRRPKNFSLDATNFLAIIQGESKKKEERVKVRVRHSLRRSRLEAGTPT
jgi:hypothetical protein